MNAADRKKMSSMDESQLAEKLTELRKDIFGFRMQKGLGQFGQTHVMKETRRDIARILTYLRQKQLGVSEK